MAFSTLNTTTELSPADADEIRGTAKWARTLAILGFVMLGFLLVGAIFMGSFFSKLIATQLSMQASVTGQRPAIDPSMFSALYSVLFALAIVIYFFPTLFLYQYATRTLRSLRADFDPARFSSGLKAHRSFYGYITILTIIVVGLDVVAFLFMGLGMFAMQHAAGQ